MKPTLPEPEIIDKHIPTGVVIRGYTAKTVQRLIDEAYAAGQIEAIPADVIGLVTFMQAAFTPMTPQQEEILKQLNLAAGAIRALKGKA